MGEPIPRLSGTGCEGEASKDYIETILMHDILNQSNGGPFPVARTGVGFGDSVTGEVYYPANLTSASAPLEVVIVLPGYFYNTGFNPGHYSTNWMGGGPASHGDVYHVLAANGYAALGFDPEGMGARVLRDSNPNRFYDRYPNSSRWARQMQDLESALAWLRCATSSSTDECATNPPPSGSPHPDGVRIGYPQPFSWLGLPALRKRVWLAGYSVGGLQALQATALDPFGQIAGVASFAGWTPLRTDASTRPTGGLQRYSHWHALLPRLGLFIGKENEVPFDVDELIDAIAPRPTLLYTPQNDADATYSDVAAVVAEAQKANKNLLNMAPAEGHGSTSQFGRVQIDALVGWLGNVTTIYAAAGS